MTMPKHRAPEPTVEIPVVKKTGKVKAILVYCQPLYKRYKKFLVAAAGAALLALQAAITDGTITSAEWYMILTSALAAAGVWKFPNATQKKVVKTQ
jgi:hypothetical protein